MNAKNGDAWETKWMNWISSWEKTTLLHTTTSISAIDDTGLPVTAMTQRQQAPITFLKL
jgi:hypothetical protein